MDPKSGWPARRPPGGLPFSILLGLALPALAGCLGGPASPPSESQASGSLWQTPAPPAPDGSLDPSTGAIEGGVRTEQGAGIPNAHVALIGSNHFTDTDIWGRFALSWIEPGTYVLRADAEGYRSLEAYVRVYAGLVTAVDVTLAAAVGPDAADAGPAAPPSTLRFALQESPHAA